MAEPRIMEGQVALITGASRGIGKAVARELGLAGAAVLISSRKLGALDDAREELLAAGVAEVSTMVANAGDEDQAEACVGAALERYGRLDVLVNNAATNPHYGPLLDIDRTQADKTLQVNLMGPIWWTRAAWRQWMRGHGGSVVNVSSVGGLLVERNIGFYNLTKAALLHLTRHLAIELAPDVRVNAVAPGLIKTDMARALWERDEPRLSEETPLGRLGEPRDIAQAVLHLASDRSAWMTGQVLVVDGGATVRPLETSD